MAFVAQGWKLVLSFVDAGGNPTSRTFDLVATDDAGDLSPVIDDVTAIIAAYTAATDAILVSQQVSKVTLNDSVVLPTTSVNVEENLQVSAKIAGMPNKSAVFEIPAPKIGAFQQTSGPGRNLANFTTGPLPDVVNLFTTGGKVYISDGEVITAQGIKGKRVHHKSTKG